MGKNQIRELLESWWEGASVAFDAGKDDVGKAYVACATALSRAAKKTSGDGE